jgi:histone deacetylase HOS3
MNVVTQDATNILVFLQDACLEHQYIRSRDTSQIVERPERIRAVKIGLAAAISHLEGVPNTSAIDETDDLSTALDRMNLGTPSTQRIKTPIQLVHSSATVKILDNPAVKFIHGDIDGDVYLEKLVEWARKSQDNVAKGNSEIPEGLSQTDLYCEFLLQAVASDLNEYDPLVCPTSVQAISGAIGTVCEAVDTVVQNASTSGPTRAFCAIRPPGHHCGEDSPSGFCFVNNVAIGAAYGKSLHLCIQLPD